MMTMNMKEFEGNTFAIQLITKGSYIDNVVNGDSGVDERNAYLIEAYTIRLNHVALNAWILSHTMNSRDVYDTDEEWEFHKAKYKARLETWNNKIIDALGIDEASGGISITQSQSEVFTVVHIRELS